jgi:hypothetical protein
MPRFLIELSHGDEHTECVRALHVIERYGSHMLTHADWGCKDGVHSGWLIVELDSRDEAMMMVPPEYRREARIVELRKFSREEVEALAAELEE